jgi:hypothetical protein
MVPAEPAADAADQVRVVAPEAVLLTEVIDTCEGAPGAMKVPESVEFQKSVCALFFEVTRAK